MSLEINVDRVWGVLLSDGWHDVAPQADDKGISSFNLDAYEFVWDETLIVGGGTVAGVPSTGFSFREVVKNPPSTQVRRIAGPLTAILAVRLD